MTADNIVTNVYAKFNYDRSELRNEKVLGNWKSDNKSQQEQQRS